MSDLEEATAVAERLGRLLDRGLLPAGGPAEAAERLIERLQRPARVALLGLPGAGKSSILNLLAGATVVPETLRLPTIIVQFGNEPRMLCTLADGQIVDVPGSDLEKALPLSPVLITLELNLPALRIIGLLEVAAGPMEAEQRRAALWAGKRADIIIWCSTAYLPKEQLVWEGLPDGHKDNGFLLLTKIDLLGGRETASGMYQRVAQRAAGEFRQVIPISAREAREAAAPGKQVDRDRFRESGATTLISTIKSRVQMARRADMDTAELLLARHSEQAAPPPPRPKFELRSVETLSVAEPSEEALAAETAALMRIAAATADVEVVASAKATDALDAPQDAPTLSEPDPFPEHVFGGEEPEIDLGAFVDHEPEQPTAQPDPIESAPIEAAEETGPADPILDGQTIASQDAAPDPTEDVTPEPVEIAETALTTGEEANHTAQTSADLSDAQAESQQENSHGFAARLKQITPDIHSNQAGLVPLKATWRARHDSISAMPIVPKPAPNLNPTPRQIPESRATEARPLNAGTNAGDVSHSRKTPPTEMAAGGEEPSAHVVRPAHVEARPHAEAPVERPAAATEAALRQPRHSSVFGARPRPDLPKAPAVDGNQLPSDGPQLEAVMPVAQPEPDAAASAPPVAPLVEGQGNAESLPELPQPVANEPGVDNADPDLPRPSLSRRIGRGGRVVSVLLKPQSQDGSPGSPQFAEPLAEVAPVSDIVVERRERPRIAPRSVSVTGPSVQAGPPGTLPASERALLEQGVFLIRSRSTELADLIDPDDRNPTELVLDHIQVTLDHAQDVLSKAESPLLSGVKGSLSEIQDFIMLMQLEKGRAPADDALTLLLQLRREMETLCAG